MNNPLCKRNNQGNNRENAGLFQLWCISETSQELMRICTVSREVTLFSCFGREFPWPFWEGENSTLVGEIAP